MDLNDLPKITMLNSEKEAIRQATQSLDGGGRIVEMTIGSQPQEGPVGRPPFAGVRIPTTYIDYPPQMVDAIKAAFETRLQVIERELGTLGVTGARR